MLSAYGCKAAQFVDLLGYFSLRMIQKTESANQVSLLTILKKTKNPPTLVADKRIRRQSFECPSFPERTVS